MFVASFLGGAKNRLLPASVPFRFFATAVGFHLAAWTMLLVGADDLPGFAGGPGLILAALHLLTLGTFTMTAIGASYQLLPVATGQPMARVWLTKLSYWFFAPGVAALSVGMIEATPILLHAGATGVTIGLIIFLYLTSHNLFRAAGSMPVVAGHGWLAMAALVGFVSLGLVLVIDFTTGFLEDRQAIVIIHMSLAAFGFMAVLVFGFSQVLIPMFIMSRALPAKIGWSELALAGAALVITIAAEVLKIAPLTVVAQLLALASIATYLLVMRAAFKTRMRKRLGYSFIIIRASWALMVVAMLVGLAVNAGAPVPNGTTLFGFLVLVGWLLTFLMAILQRIMPFLASMHAAGKNGSPPLLSELTLEPPLKIHGALHGAAIVLCAIGIVTDWPLLVQFGAGAGILAAVSFIAFSGFVMMKLRTKE